MQQYKDEMDKGVAGAIATTENKDIISRTVETEDGIGFGVPVAQGENDKGIRKTQAGDTKFVGITVLDRTASDLINDKFIKYESARVMIKGVIWVQVAEDVKAGDPVAVTVADGKFKKTADESATVTYPNARYETSATNGNLAQVRLK